MEKKKTFNLNNVGHIPICKSIAKESGMRYEIVKDIYSRIFLKFFQVLDSGKTISIPNFGKFKTHRSKAKVYKMHPTFRKYNPAEEIKTPSRRVVDFISSNNLKARMNANTDVKNRHHKLLIRLNEERKEVKENKRAKKGPKSLKDLKY